MQKGSKERVVLFEVFAGSVDLPFTICFGERYRGQFWAALTVASSGLGRVKNPVVSCSVPLLVMGSD